MSKVVFKPDGVPTEPQAIGEPDFSSDSIIDGSNPFIMRSRARAGSLAGVWVPPSLIEYKSDANSDGSWATGSDSSKLYEQLSTIGASGSTSIASRFYAASPNSYVDYVKETTINLDAATVVNAAITGVDVWFRWLPKAAFKRFAFTGSKISGVTSTGYNCPLDEPCGSWQDEAYVPPEWTFVGTRASQSFSVTIPIPDEYRQFEATWAAEASKPTDSGSPRNLRKQYVDANFIDVWFQILVTGHSTWKPNPYNYRWIGDTGRYVESDYATGQWASLRRYWSSGAPAGSIGNYRVGEYFNSHLNDRSVANYRVAGYLPWNPFYGAAVQTGWDTYRRQRTTFGDIAIFAPRRWRKYFYPEDYTGG